VKGRIKGGLEQSKAEFLSTSQANPRDFFIWEVGIGEKKGKMGKIIHEDLDVFCWSQGRKKVGRIDSEKHSLWKWVEKKG